MNSTPKSPCVEKEQSENMMEEEEEMKLKESFALPLLTKDLKVEVVFYFFLMNLLK